MVWIGADGINQGEEGFLDGFWLFLYSAAAAIFPPWRRAPRRFATGAL